jgi:hypothetical protein
MNFEASIFIFKFKSEIGMASTNELTNVYLSVKFTQMETPLSEYSQTKPCSWTLFSSVTNAETYKRQINFLVGLHFITLQTSYLNNKYWTEVVMEPKHMPLFALNFCSYFPFTTPVSYFSTVSQKQIVQKLYRMAQTVFTNITFSRYRGI